MATNNQGVVWKKRILVPFWIFRILCNLVIIVISAIAIKLIKDAEGYDKHDKAPAIGVVAVFMLLIIACLLIDVLAILLFLRDALKPLTLLIMSVFQTGFWVIVVILDIVAIARGAYGGGVAFSFAILASYAGILCYAAIQYHKQRKDIKRGQYSSTANPESVPLGSTYNNYGGPLQNTNTTYTSPAPYQPPPRHGASATYHQDSLKIQV